MKSNYLLKFIVLSLLFFSLKTTAQRIMSLDSCRLLALANNKELKISKKELSIADLEKKAAFTNYLPKISAIGTYIRNQKSASLLSDKQKNTLSRLGVATSSKLQEAGTLVAKKYPSLAPVIQDIGKNFGGKLAGTLDHLGKQLVDDLSLDTKNLYLGIINIKQPIFLGGKIRAYHRITGYLEEISSHKNKLLMEKILLETDKAYWRIVSLSHKKKLTDNYVNLLQSMNNDVDKMITQGVATKADGLNIKVKLNEAEMKQTKATNGLELSKMALNQICGLPLSTSITLTDEHKTKLVPNKASSSINFISTEAALDNRTELKSLELVQKAKKEKITIERAEFLPKVALSGNYIVTNPSSTNGFENKFKGMWNVGLQVKIPIWNWREGAYKIKIAKTEASIIDDQIEEAKEKITLQIHQAKFKLNEAYKKVKMTQKNIDKAEENLRYAKLGFKEGVIPASMVLKAQTAWYNAQSENIDAEIEVKLTQIQLKKALGILNI